MEKGGFSRPPFSFLPLFPLFAHQKTVSVSNSVSSALSPFASEKRKFDRYQV